MNPVPPAVARQHAALSHWIPPTVVRPITALFLLLAVTALPAADYFVDSESGNDTHSGTAPGQAWRSLARVNDHVFQPGDRLLFRAGSRFTGQLAPRGSGTAERPIRIGQYDDGPLPRLDGHGEVQDTVLLRNVEFWIVEDLEVTNLGPERAPWRTGVRVVADNFGTMRHIHLRRLYVHDVNGDLRKSHEGCGIYFETRGRRTPSRFDDLLIEHCRVVRADRNGICQRNGSGPRSLRVVIRHNLLEDIGGDGIKAWGSNGPLIEHNIVRGARMRCTDAAAGIWPFDCDDALIQFNEVSGVKGTLDGQGFDSDYRCRRSVFQYNYSHHNEGGFMLICAPGHSWNEGTLIRYNLSQNDGVPSARVFHFGGGSSNTWVYNNTIYIGPDQNVPLLKFDGWDGGHPVDVKFFNNIFYVDGRVSYDWGTGSNVVFSHNVFYGGHAEIPPDPFAVTNRPPLRAPGTGGNGFASLTGYLPADRAAFPRGRFIPDNGGRDFFGVPLGPEPPLIGASEGAPPGVPLRIVIPGR
ncbi:MAG: right-handed parallel beta-helix repeat-containing protein [Limisphaerales bacterium]